MDDRSGTITQYRIQYSCPSCFRAESYISAQQSLIYPMSSLWSGEQYIFHIAACVGDICGHTRSSLTVNVPPVGMYNHIVIEIVNTMITIMIIIILWSYEF